MRHRRKPKRRAKKGFGGFGVEHGDGAPQAHKPRRSLLLVRVSPSRHFTLRITVPRLGQARRREKSRELGDGEAAFAAEGLAKPVCFFVFVWRTCLGAFWLEAGIEDE